MKHVKAISKGPQQAQTGTGETLSIIATALSALAAIFTAFGPLFGNKE